MSMNEARKDFAMAAFDGHLYAVAGQDENIVMHTAERFSITENEWRSMAPIPGGALYCHQVIVCECILQLSLNLCYLQIVYCL